MLKEIASYPMPNRQVTVSAGVATYPTDGKSLPALIKRADVRLYKAKREGKNKIVG